MMLPEQEALAVLGTHRHDEGDNVREGIWHYGKVIISSYQQVAGSLSILH